MKNQFALCLLALVCSSNWMVPGVWGYRGTMRLVSYLQANPQPLVEGEPLLLVLHPSVSQKVQVRVSISKLFPESATFSSRIQPVGAYLTAQPVAFPAAVHERGLDPLEQPEWMRVLQPVAMRAVARPLFRGGVPDGLDPATTPISVQEASRVRGPRGDPGENTSDFTVTIRPQLLPVVQGEDALRLCHDVPCQLAIRWKLVDTQEERVAVLAEDAQMQFTVDDGVLAGAEQLVRSDLAGVSSFQARMLQHGYDVMQEPANNNMQDFLQQMQAQMGVHLPPLGEQVQQQVQQQGQAAQVAAAQDGEQMRNLRERSREQLRTPERELDCPICMSPLGQPRAQSPQGRVILAECHRDPVTGRCVYHGCHRACGRAHMQRTHRCLTCRQPVRIHQLSMDA